MKSSLRVEYPLQYSENASNVESLLGGMRSSDESQELFQFLVRTAEVSLLDNIKSMDGVDVSKLVQDFVLGGFQYLEEKQVHALVHVALESRLNSQDGHASTSIATAALAFEMIRYPKSAERHFSDGGVIFANMDLRKRLEYRKSILDPSMRDMRELVMNANRVQDEEVEKQSPIVMPSSNPGPQRNHLSYFAKFTTHPLAQAAFIAALVVAVGIAVASGAGLVGMAPASTMLNSVATTLSAHAAAAGFSTLAAELSTTVVGAAVMACATLVSAVMAGFLTHGFITNQQEKHRFLDDNLFINLDSSNEFSGLGAAGHDRNVK